MLRLRQYFFTILAVAAFSHVSPAQQVQQEVKRKLVSKRPPSYPEIARRMQITGVVRLEVHIQPNGTVGSAKVIGGHPMLAQAAQDAVNKWKWVPAIEATTEIVEMTFSPQQ
ncbi:MAG TPA: energy transducer TonB [Terriglobales bacterium]|nr:energy transducer TonB [Terriglobales bacterium]